MFSSGPNAGVGPSVPLVNCIVNDPLLHVGPHVNLTSCPHPGLLSRRLTAALCPRFCSQLGSGLGCSAATNLARQMLQ